MSELTWYSRLLVWVGAVILLVESLTGRTLGLVTVVGVVALAVGLLAFVGGLALDGRPVRLPLYDAAGEIDREETRPLSMEPSGSASLPTPEPAQEIRSTAAAEQVAVATGERRGAVGLDLDPRSPYVGAVCLACLEPLRPGQVAAECRQCHTVQHAACWVGNRFHCARDGCDGQGPLEAPGSLDESPGPSTA